MNEQLHFPFPPFPYSRASNLGKIDANFPWESVTSSAVLDHLVINGICGTFDIKSNHFDPVIPRKLKKF